MRSNSRTLAAYLSICYTYQISPTRLSRIEASSFRISGRGSGSAGTSRGRAIHSRGQKRCSGDPDSSLSLSLSIHSRRGCSEFRKRDRALLVGGSWPINTCGVNTSRRMFGQPGPRPTVPRIRSSDVNPLVK